jgi:hypothetical protein
MNATNVKYGPAVSTLGTAGEDQRLDAIAAPIGWSLCIANATTS